MFRVVRGCGHHRPHSLRLYGANAAFLNKSQLSAGIPRMSPPTNVGLWLHRRHSSVARNLHWPAAMSARVVLATAALMLLTANSAIAGPITDLSDVLVGDGFVLRSGHSLTYDDWLQLAARDDHGWHLGWFKRKLRAGTDIHPHVGWPSFPEFSEYPFFSPIGLPPSTSIAWPPSIGLESPWVVGPSSGQPFINLDTQATTPIAAPEPGSLVLMGTGLLIVVRRLRHRVPRRK